MFALPEDPTGSTTAVRHLEGYQATPGAPAATLFQPQDPTAAGVHALQPGCLQPGWDMGTTAAWMYNQQQGNSKQQSSGSTPGVPGMTPLPANFTNSSSIHAVPGGSVTSLYGKLRHKVTPATAAPAFVQALASNALSEPADTPSLQSARMALGPQPPTAAAAGYMRKPAYAASAFSSSGTSSTAVPGTASHSSHSSHGPTSASTLSSAMSNCDTYSSDQSSTATAPTPVDHQALLALLLSGPGTAADASPELALQEHHQQQQQQQHNSNAAAGPGGAASLTDLGDRARLMQQLQQLQLNQSLTGPAAGVPTLPGAVPVSIGMGLQAGSNTAMLQNLQGPSIVSLQQQQQQQQQFAADSSNTVDLSTASHIMRSLRVASPFNQNHLPVAPLSQQQQQQPSTALADLLSLLNSTAPAGATSCSAYASMQGLDHSSAGLASTAATQVLDPSMYASFAQGLNSSSTSGPGAVMAPWSSSGGSSSAAALGRLPVSGMASGVLQAGAGSVRQHQGALGPLNNPMYKTELCRTWLDTGSCRYGSRCQFAHGETELRPARRHPKYKTQLCRTFALHGSCPYGDRCNFIHDQPKSSPTLLLQGPSSGSTTCSSSLINLLTSRHGSNGSDTANADAAGGGTGSTCNTGDTGGLDRGAGLAAGTSTLGGSATATAAGGGPSLCQLMSAAEALGVTVPGRPCDKAAAGSSSSGGGGSSSPTWAAVDSLEAFMQTLVNHMHAT